jgi:excisionase family DNA binding protein
MNDASENPSIASNKLLFSQKESASILGVSLRTIQNLIFAKQLPIRRIGRRVLVHRKHLEDFARHDHVDSCKGGVMAVHANKLDVQRYERRERIHDAERKGLKTSERREVLA